jgi:hypothetical protein
MRRLSVLVVSAVLALGISAQASAGTVTSASLSLTVGALPPIVITDVTPDFGVGTDSFLLPFTPSGATPTVALPTALFSGVSLISGLTLAVSPGTVNVASNGTATGIIGGTTFVNILKLFNLNIPLSLGGGATIQAVAGGLVITVTPAAGTGWTTGAVSITGIATGPETAMVNTLTASGSPTVTGATTTLALIWGARTTTSAAGNLPLFAKLSISGKNLKAPEPGHLLAGAAALAAAGFVARARRNRQT